MSESQQKNIIQPRKLAQKSGEIRFNWEVASFERLSNGLYSNVGNVSVHINAEIDFQKRCLLETNIKASLQLECQTSFEPMDFEIDKTITFCTVIKESQFAEVDEEFEPVLIDDGYLDIKQVIEDELILSVPVAANKPAEELNQEMTFGKLDEEAILVEKKEKNPFSVLKNLKKT